MISGLHSCLSVFPQIQHTKKSWKSSDLQIQISCLEDFHGKESGEEEF
jgi:hypothetical protein